MRKFILWALFIPFITLAIIVISSKLHSQQISVSLGTAATQNIGTSGANVAMLNGQNIWSSGQILPKTIVSSLPSCVAGIEGMVYAVSDALLPAALSAITGGGAVHVLAYCNGTTWIVL